MYVTLRTSVQKRYFGHHGHQPDISFIIKCDGGHGRYVGSEPMFIIIRAIKCRGMLMSASYAAV